MNLDATIDVVVKSHYILAGILLALVFVGLYKIFLNFISGKRLFFPYLFLSVMMPIVIWQRTFEIAIQLQSEIVKNFSKPKLFAFSLFCLFSWGILYAIAQTLFPAHDKNDFAFSSPKWKEHVKTNRRIFFFLSFLYLLTVIVSNHILKAEIPCELWIVRILMILVCLIAFLSNYEVEGDTLISNIRIAWPKGSWKNGTLRIDLVKDYKPYNRQKMICEKKAQKERKRKYNEMDFLASIGIILGFIGILFIRYMS